MNTSSLLIGATIGLIGMTNSFIGITLDPASAAVIALIWMAAGYQAPSTKDKK